MTLSEIVADPEFGRSWRDFKAKWPEFAEAYKSFCDLFLGDGRWAYAVRIEPNDDGNHVIIAYLYAHFAGDRRLPESLASWRGYKVKLRFHGDEEDR